MHSESVISVENVSKKFARTLKDSMIYGLTDMGRNILGREANSGLLRKNEFLAVDDVSFEIKRGESFGLIGPNGSGKTTLLKMLNGIFWPDKGKITVKGKVSALIAVGAGFHPLLTGRENIYINGAILGMNKKEIDRKFDAIIDFADIGDFLDTPIKNYSSGMHVRLGFAIAVHCEPDILLVDEVLAVGDKDFQIKCYQKINEIRTNGTTIILVAHNEYTIREYASRCLYLSHGQNKFCGPAEDAISLYIKDTLENKSHKTPIHSSERSTFDKKAELISLKFYDSLGEEVTFLESGEELNIELECMIHEHFDNPVFAVNFYDNKGFMYCANSFYENQEFNGNLMGRVKIKINVPRFHLPSNNYLCSTLVASGNPDNLMDCQIMAYKFVVGRARNARGSIKLPTKWEIVKMESGVTP